MISAFVLGLSWIVQEPVAELFGKDVGVKLVRVNGEILEEYYAKDEAGKLRLIVVSPTHEAAGPKADRTQITALSTGASSLFSSAPTFRFDSYQKLTQGGSHELILMKHTADGDVSKHIRVPEKGNVFDIQVNARFHKPKPMIHFLLCSYAFAPDGKPSKPDTTFAPGLRPNPGNVIGDHFFRAPVVMAQKGRLAASLLPDLDVLAENRPIPTIIDLDADSGVNDAALLSYGFCDHKLTGHVNFSTNPGMIRQVPSELTMAMQLILDANATPRGAYESANTYLWERYGSRHFDKVLPQVMPFRNYAGACYPAVMEEHYGDNKLGWFTRNIAKGGPLQHGEESEAEREEESHRAPNPDVVGGIPSGWGFTNGWVSWQCWFNQLRSAWGLKWWGEQANDKHLEERAEKMLNLALAAPMDQGAVPTTYLSRENTWRGSLIMPTTECYYDLPSIAWKGIWMLKWLEFEDCPRKDEILKQCLAMAGLMVKKQNADGSYPSWLDKSLKAIPVLDHSAQSALPAWFLLELAKRAPSKEQAEFKDSALKACDFLMANVVDQQRYYDFETFFSCSPKECLANGVVDNPEMHDTHTLQPPQNTLCMQWTAEALRAAKHATGKELYMEGAMKALNMMMLYQNVWPIAYRHVANTFGGFGVQNSDGEYNDARQAQFGCTLMDFGAELGRKDLFERGIAATRAAMTLINHPLHVGNDVYPDPNYPYGLQPENNGHGGTDQQNGRTGFDWGEGSGLASMAYALDKFGGVYVDDKNGWAVGIDGVTTDGKGEQVTAVMASNKMPWTGDYSVEVRYASGKESRTVHPAPALKIRRIDPEFTDGKLLVVAIPSWTSNGGGAHDFKGELKTSRGKRYPVSIVDKGFGAAIPVSEMQGATVRLEGTFNGKPIQCEEFSVLVDPIIEFDSWTLPAGWKYIGSFPQIPTHSTRLEFNNGGKGFIGTCEDGKGGYDDEFTGTVTSPLFMATNSKMRLMVGGGNGKDTYVELLSASGESLMQARGKNSERMEEVLWDLTPYVGQMLRMRIVDQATGGWGHINVGTITVGK